MTDLASCREVTTDFKRYKMKRARLPDRQAYGSKLRKTIDTVRAVGSANVVITDFSPLCNGIENKKRAVGSTHFVTPDFSPVSKETKQKREP